MCVSLRDEESLYVFGFAYIFVQIFKDLQDKVLKNQHTREKIRKILFTFFSKTPW